MSTISSNNKKKYSERETAHKIIKLIRHKEKQLKRKFSILNYPNIIGMSCMTVSCIGIILFSVLYIYGLIPAWLCVIANAILASILHEIEHDLIHDLYFKTNKRLQHFMFWTVWIFRANIANPWTRKSIHLLHHKKSGRLNDIEERFIGNGMAFGLRRCLTMIEPLTALITQGKKIKRDAHNELQKIPNAFNVAFLNKLFYFLWYTFLILVFFNFINNQFNLDIKFSAWMKSFDYFLYVAAIIYLIPAWLRQACLQIISSNIHYFGEIDNVVKQTQVLDSWIIFPLQLFCFNFGSTHCIHHFVVNQPFYLRQMLAPFAKPVLKKYGIKFNEFESMLNNNQHPDALYF